MSKEIKLSNLTILQFNDLFSKKKYKQLISDLLILESKPDFNGIAQTINYKLDVFNRIDFDINYTDFDLLNCYDTNKINVYESISNYKKNLIDTFKECVKDLFGTEKVTYFDEATKENLELYYNSRKEDFVNKIKYDYILFAPNKQNKIILKQSEYFSSDVTIYNFVKRIFKFMWAMDKCYLLNEDLSKIIWDNIRDKVSYFDEAKGKNIYNDNVELFVKGYTLSFKIYNSSIQVKLDKTILDLLKK